ncbi:MAG TPA: NAD(P)-dependent oxidoreductase [Armatimonadota bacterium]|nr:NAD(P)-dependent oxidoreductase [Armatimonadota bacterium]
MKVVITGAAGRLGASVRAELANRHQIRAFDLLPCPTEESIVGDLLDADTRHRALEGADAVVHLACFPQTWNSPRSYAVNAQGTYMLLETAQSLGLKRFIYASTFSVFSSRQWAFYGSRGALSEAVLPEPQDVYGLTKYLGEEACRLFARRGMHCTILRLTVVTMPENWEDARRKGWGGVTHAADAAQAFRLALETEHQEGTARLCHICGDHANKPTPIDQARAMLGFSPRYNMPEPVSSGSAALPSGTRRCRKQPR